MLSNYIIGNHKFVLFIDNVGMEQNGVKVVENVLNENNVNFEKLINESCEFNQKTSVILTPISKLELTKSEQEIFTLIQSFKNSENVNQIFAWATVKNISSKFLIPFLDYMADVTVTIKSNQHLSVLTKKRSGNVKLKDYQHELNLGKTMIKEIQQKSAPKEEVKTEDPEVIGTFKIGQFKNDELEAKKNLKLPFEIM
jgi:hypothetical protein